MNALVKKEIRLLLPSWVAAISLAVGPALLMLTIGKAEAKLVVENPDAPMWTEIFLLLGIIFLGIASFGQEFSFKTFPLLLSQPIPRKQIWFAKTSLLAFALVSVLLAALASWSIYFYLRPGANWSCSAFLFSNLKTTWLGVFVFFSGGLWSALLLRQVSGAFWFTLLIPGAMAVLFAQLSDRFHWSDNLTNFLIIGILLLYSAAGFFFARKLFFNAQDVQWMGGNVLFPWRRKAREQSRTFVPAFARNRFLALIWKEIQLHEGSLFIAAILFVLHLATIPGRVYISNPDFRAAFEIYWTLWLLMPLVIGGVAVAEERKSGTLEFQLCLPVRRTAQFSIKFFVALVLSVLFGAAMPSLMEHTRNFKIESWMNYWIFIAAPLIFFISFYASTLARSTLQALGMAIGIPTAVWAGLAGLAAWWTSGFTNYENSYWVVLAILIGVPLLPLVLARLMFWNFKWLHRDWNLWRRNAAVVLGFFAAVSVLSCGIYYRTWEIFLPKDCPHGAVRITDSRTIKLSGGGAICAILPDGRLWLGTTGYGESSWMHGEEIFSLKPGHAQFADGTNWISVAAGWPNILALKSDGSLWRAAQMRYVQNGYGYDSQGSFKRIGSETNWSQIAGRGSVYGFLLLKNDGSLWIWGTNFVHLGEKYARDFTTPPVKIGEQTNWTELLMVDNTTYAKNKNGETWAWKYGWNVTNDFRGLVAVTNLESFWQMYDRRAVGITNGELWFATGDSDYGTGEFHAVKKLQLGLGMKWKAARFGYSRNTIIALRDDRTLWRFSGFNKSDVATMENPDAARKEIQTTRLGIHSDWIAFIPNWGNLVLAADGGLWLWDEQHPSIIGPSRQPVFMGNLFEAAN